MKMERFYIDESGNVCDKLGEMHLIRCSSDYCAEHYCNFLNKYIGFDINDVQK